MVSLNISSDFLDVCDDFHVSATLRLDAGDITLNSCVLNAPATWSEVDAAREDATTQQGTHGTGGQVLRSGVLFVWPKSKSDRPPLGTIILDSAGKYWTIWNIVDRQHPATWAAKCLDLNVVTAAANEATILVATFGKGDANEAVAAWYGLWSGELGGDDDDVVPARFQPSGETAALDFGADTTEEAFRVYLDATSVPIDLAGGEYRLVDTEGNRYRVFQYYNEGRIDRLPVAFCRRIVEGAEYDG